MKSSISALWSAKSVAIIGATERSGAMGRLPLEYLQKYGFAGEIFPVNPKGGEILGIKSSNYLQGLKFVFVQIFQFGQILYFQMLKSVKLGS